MAGREVGDGRALGMTRRRSSAQVVLGDWKAKVEVVRSGSDARNSLGQLGGIEMPLRLKTSQVEGFHSKAGKKMTVYTG